MSQSSAKLREFADSLIALETIEESADAKSLPAFNAIEKLGPHLAMLMGKAGFRAILSRAIALASGEFAWLANLQVGADGSLNGSDEIARQINSRELAGGAVSLVNQLLGLLVAFIGEDLTIRLLCEVWPELCVSYLDSANKGSNEKTK